MTLPLYRFLVGATATAALAAHLGAAPAQALPRQSTGDPWELCGSRTADQERAGTIPEDLLAAISFAESGRWDDRRGEIVAWPWTITAEGEGRFLATKAAAIAEVRELQHRGIKNIDVGCMQVNLRHHGDAFENLADALDPDSNVAYAAKFLTALHDETRSWTQAAAYYHSRTPERGDAYKMKVVRLWNQAREDGPTNRRPEGRNEEKARAAETRSEDERASAAYRPAPIDAARTARLNNRLKIARAAARAAEGKGAVRLNQLDAWRRDRVRSMGTAHLSAMRRARLVLERREKFLARRVKRTEADFSERYRGKPTPFHLLRRGRPGAS